MIEEPSLRSFLSSRFPLLNYLFVIINSLKDGQNNKKGQSSRRSPSAIHCITYIYVFDDTMCYRLGLSLAIFIYIKYTKSRVKKVSVSDALPSIIEKEFREKKSSYDVLVNKNISVL